jgi:hypothetical protein
MAVDKSLSDRLRRDERMAFRGGRTSAESGQGSRNAPRAVRPTGTGRVEGGPRTSSLPRPFKAAALALSAVTPNPPASPENHR